MAKLNTILLADTFGTWLTGANEAYTRLNQFAVNESSLYANTFSANVALQVNTIRQRVAGPITINANTNIVGTFANVVSTNTNIAGGTLLVSSNVNFTGAGFQIQTGEVELYTDTGSPSYIKFFCENTNQHGIKIQSPTHAEMIGASNRALTIPAANGYLLWGSTSDDSRQTLTSNVHFTGANVHFEGANVLYKGQLLDTRYANVAQAALANTNAYIATMQTIAVERAALANTNAYIALMSTDVQLANTNAYIGAVVTSLNQRLGSTSTVALTGDITASATAFSSNTVSIATTDTNLGNTNLAITNLNTNLLATNTAIRLVDSQRLANTNSYIATMQTIAIERAALANTNAYIALMSTDVQLANTNAYIATKTTESTALSRLANTNAYIATMQTIATERAALANTNAYIASMSTDVQLANTNAYIGAVVTSLNQRLGKTATVALTGDITASATAFSSNTVSIATTDTNLGNTNSYIATMAPLAGAAFVGATSVSAMFSANQLEVSNTHGAFSGSARVNIQAGHWAENTLGLYSSDKGGADHTGLGFYNENGHQGTDLYQDPTRNFSITCANTIMLKYGSHGITGGTPALTMSATGEMRFYRQSNSAIYTNMASTGSVTLDFASYTHFHLKLTGNVTLANPSTEISGSQGLIFCKQDASGSRTLSLGTDFETPAAAGVTLSTGANDEDIIPYYVTNTSCILLGQIQRNFA